MIANTKLHSIVQPKLPKGKKNNFVMRNLVIALILESLMSTVKIIGGINSNCLVLLSDVIHLFAFLIAAISIGISNFQTTKLHSFGYH